MDYKKSVGLHEDGKHLISMNSPEKLLSLGSMLDLSEDSTVLDLCCGYGTMLKIWNEAFGISGTGVNLNGGFIETGGRRLSDDAKKRITLIHGDVLQYEDPVKYDVVFCNECFLGMDATIEMLEKYVKDDGIIVLGTLFSKVPEPPKELTDFDGPLLTLDEIYTFIRKKDYFLLSFVADNDIQWEKYISWSTKNDLQKLKDNPADDSTLKWIDKWYHMYFKYRRYYEGFGLFALKRINHGI